MIAIARQIRISAKKANLVANLIRNKKAQDAVNILKFTTKKAAPIIRKVVESAMANAENNFKHDKNNLYIKEVLVSGGTTYKRGIHISRGRQHPLLKRTAHIKVELESRGEKVDEPAKVKKASAQREREQVKRVAMPPLNAVNLSKSPQSNSENPTN